MPLRDDEVYQKRRQQIIDGALVVFAEKGFDKATNKEIARAAGIGSPGLIYHYFEDKADLLRQLIQSRSPLLQAVMGGDMALDRPLHELLDLVGRAFLAVLMDEEGLALARVIVGEALRRPALADILRNLGQARLFEILEQHLRLQMDAGVLRRTDPGAAVRCFIGPLIAYILTRKIILLPDSSTLSPEAMVSVTVETFLRGMDYHFPEAEGRPGEQPPVRPE